MSQFGILNILDHYNLRIQLKSIFSYLGMIYAYILMRVLLSMINVELNRMYEIFILYG